MDQNGLQNRPCFKNSSNIEQESHSSYEIDGKGSSLSEMNEFDAWARNLDEVVNNLDLYANGNAINISLGTQQAIFTESEQNNSKFTENNANFSAQNSANENTGFNLAPDCQIIYQQQENNLGVGPSNQLVDVSNVSSDKEESITDYLTKLSISGWESNACHFDIKSNIHNCIATFQPDLYEQNKGWASNTTNLIEGDGENNVNNPDLRSKIDACITESFENSERSLSYCNDIHKTNDMTVNCGFSQRQSNEGTKGILPNSEVPQTQILPVIHSQAWNNRGNEVSRSGERIALVNETKAVAGPSSMNVEDQMLQEGGCLKCQKCGKVCRSKSELVRHYRIHTGEKPFACGNCVKSFAQKYSLNMHLLTHTGEKPFACETCGKGFTRKRNMQEHFRIHTGEKPFTCDTCGKSFAREKNLKDHLPTHTQEKPFVCYNCGKGFARKSTMKEHFKIHSGEKLFTCDRCGKSFGIKSNLKRHLLTHIKQKFN